MAFICSYMGFDVYGFPTEGYYNAKKFDTPTLTSEFLDELFDMIEKYYREREH